ncbi:hypothetical protein HPB50_012249 [Hyalomma asiaticum]|uniref:Uncharacterized protein n=1 Tax=Hyalomma asiaticum TaxID=266040 RepID=A0ACB7TGQ9_HYAAI|nr:hypothetical protein HPB50_012249 [Hyalomma asiaticum]
MFAPPIPLADDSNEIIVECKKDAPHVSEEPVGFTFPPPIPLADDSYEIMDDQPGKSIEFRFSAPSNMMLKKALVPATDYHPFNAATSARVSEFLQIDTPPDSRAVKRRRYLTAARRVGRRRQQRLKAAREARHLTVNSEACEHE